MTDQNDLDGFLASAGIPSEAETVTTETATPEPSQPEPSVNRDEHGRFAPKAGEPEPVATEAEGQQPQAATPTETPSGHVPLAALHAERAKTKTLEQQMQQMQATLQALQQRPQQPQPVAEQPKPKDFWEDPNGFVADQLTPIQRQLQATALRTSKMLATQAHGRETVQAAYEELGRALQTDPQARFAYQQIMESDHPYDEMVNWHRRQQAMARVGTDPDAFIEAELEKRLSDPAFQAKVMERARAAAGSGQSQSPPLTAVPPSLSRIPTGGNAVVEADMSSEGLFRHALAGR